LPIQSRQSAASPQGQYEEMGVGHLSMPHQRDLSHGVGGRERNVVFPELVMRKGHDATQKEDGFPGCPRLGDACRVGRHPYEPAFDDRTGGPTRRMVTLEPSESRPVMDVVRPGEGDQQVDVEQRCHQLSSRARWTISSVSGLAWGETEKTGKPASI